MGKKSKSTTTNDPSKYAQGFVTPAANALSSTYADNAPKVQGVSDSLYAQLPGLTAKAFGSNPTLGAAESYNTDVLNGKYLGSGNQYLGGMIDSTARDVTDRINSQFGAAGRTGGDQHIAVLGRSLADAENGLRYQDYSNERSAMGSAAGLAPGLVSAEYAGIAPTLATAGAAAGLPMDAAGAYASGTGGLVGSYGTQTTTSTHPWYDTLLQAGSQAAGAYFGAK